MQNANRSEVARLKEQFRLERSAAWAALYSPAQGTARHKVITKRMERMSDIQDQLIGLMGEGRATRLVCELMDENSGIVEIE